ncbi:hypothetical protein BJF79_47750 [Actinomadura sp. CNU-125]|uniref:hypothetical protein n=1 Tax=Actinomadura sp. CNU-125 TaxID=1904961 RepID=UPI000967CC66|nr:hypothetical protein [Actinomadura sp. CNU-125]OLT19492.1 hypothetical protein BJF79_47750 [Actinomadura sp. CNU-125]
MRIVRTLLLITLLPLLLTACGGASLPEAADGDDLTACTDADCTVRITTGDEIPLDDRFGMTPIKVTVEEDTVTFESTDGDSGSFSTTGTVDVRNQLQNVSIEALGIKDGEAVVKVSPA